MYAELTKIGVSFQNSYGQGAGTPDVTSVYNIPFTEDSLKLSIDQLVSNNRWDQFDDGDSYEGPKKAGGDIGAEVSAIELGVLLEATQFRSSTYVGSARQHTFTPRQSDWSAECAQRPVTVCRRFSDSNNAVFDTFYDMCCSKLVLGFSAGEFMKATVSLVGGQMDADSADNIPAVVTDRRLFTWDVASFSIGGAARPQIVDMTITQDDKIEAKSTFSSSKYPSRLKRTGKRTIEISGTIRFENRDEYDQYLAQSERSMTLTCNNGLQVASGYNESLTITVPKLRWTEFAPAGGGDGPIEVSVTGAGKYDSSAGYSIRYVLVNTQINY